MEVNQCKCWRTLQALLLLLGLAMVAACQRESPEQALRVRLQQIQSAAEARDPDTFIDAVTEDFSGNAGMDRAALHNLLRVQLLGNARVGVTTGPIKVEMLGERAKVSFTAVLAGSSGRLLPDAAETYALTTGWRLEDGEWRLYHARWESAF